MKTPSFLTAAVFCGALFSSSAGAATVLFDFAAQNGQYYSVGGNAPITDNGIKMTVLAGTYEVTYASELNLKDFPATGAARTVRFEFLNGQGFDFQGLDLHDGYGTLTLTSSAGGSVSTTTLYDPITVSGAGWQNVSWVDVTVTGQYSSAKISSVSFNDVPTVPEVGSLVLSAAGLAAVGLRRRRTSCSA